MIMNNQNIYELDKVIKDSFKHIKLINYKVREFLGARELELIFDVEGITHEFHFSYRFLENLNIEEVMACLKSHLMDLIVNHYFTKENKE